MTPREQKQKRIIRKQRTRIEELRERVSCLEELSIAERKRDNLVLRVRQTIKAGLLKIATVVFLFDILEHQISRHRKFNELKKRRKEGIELNRQEKWLLDSLFVPSEDGFSYFLCTTRFLEDSMGIPKRTQSLYLKELKDKGLVQTCTAIMNGRTTRYVYVDIRKWNRMLDDHMEKERARYRKPVLGDEWDFDD